MGIDKVAGSLFANAVGKGFAKTFDHWEKAEYKGQHPQMKDLDRYQSDIYWYMYDYLNISELATKYFIIQGDMEELLRVYIKNDQSHHSSIQFVTEDVLMPHEVEKLMNEFDYAYDEAERNVYND